MIAGGLLVESYAISPGVVGVLLGAVALAALPGKMLARPWLAGHARELLVVLGIAAALLTALFGIVRPGAAASTAILAWMQSSALAPTTRPLRTSSRRPSRRPSRACIGLGLRSSVASPRRRSQIVQRWHEPGVVLTGV